MTWHMSPELHGAAGADAWLLFSLIASYAVRPTSFKNLRLMDPIAPGQVSGAGEHTLQVLSLHSVPKACPTLGSY